MGVTMKSEYKCDRCEAVAYTQAVYASVASEYGYGSYDWSHGPLPDQWRKRFDLTLCPSCSAAFDLFLLERDIQAIKKGLTEKS